MKYRRGFCVECGIKSRSIHSYYCDDCREKLLVEKIVNEDRVVESPHNSWF